MPHVTPSRNITLPIAHESSRLASPRESDSVLRQYLRHNRSGVQQDSDKIAIQNLVQQMNRLRRRILGGAQGSTPLWPWMYPDHIEGDSRYAYQSGTTMYLSAMSTLITSGMTDIVSGSVVTSCQGVWLAMQNVPAASGGKWNVPTLSYPSGAATIGGSTFAPGTAAPSGTPLKGDLDLVDSTTGKKVLFWYYLGDISPV